MSIFEIRSHKRIQQGDVKEFEKIFRKYYASLCLFARKYANDMDSAEEIVQDFFYTYWKNRQSIKIRGSLQAYIYQSVKNRALKAIEHKQVRQRYATNMKQQLEEQFEPEARTLEASEMERAIEQTLNQLPERCRQIFILSRFEGLKYQEIAQKLTISIKTVEANMGKALQHFRANLKRYDKVPG